MTSRLLPRTLLLISALVLGACRLRSGKAPLPTDDPGTVGTPPTEPPAGPPSDPPASPPADPPAAPPAGTQDLGPLAAFPGAQGGGSRSAGGRGGAVHRVTNLNDSGAGSLRACVEASGPRTCVFAVSGTIDLATALVVRQPYLTIAGQTAPGYGVQITSHALEDQSTLAIRTHDVVVRHVKLRPGNGGNSPPMTENDPFLILPGWPDQEPCVQDQSLCVPHDIVIDHVSVSWWEGKPNVYHSRYNCPGNTAAVCDGVPSQAPRDISLQWNILSEPLAAQQTNLGMGAQLAGPADRMTDIDIHHNFISNSANRNPLSGLNRVRIVNNVVYNYAGMVTRFGGPYDVIGNFYKRGPFAAGWEHMHELQILDVVGVDNTTSVSTSAYIAGNAGPYNGGDPSSDNWARLTSLVPNTSVWAEDSSPAPKDRYGRRADQCTSWPNWPAGVSCPAADSPLPTLPAGATPIGVDSALDIAKAGGTFLATVGDSRRLDCRGNWTDRRDPVDAGLIAQFLAGTGPSTPPPTPADSLLGGYPDLSGATPCADRDGDGMPDDWESHFGLDPASASGDDGPAGHALDATWTNLEVYLSGRRGF